MDDPMSMGRVMTDVPFEASGTVDVPVTGIAFRSGDVQPGCAFFCIPGFAHDGHDFAAEAVDRGAVALVVERRVDVPDVPQYLVGSAREALALASAEFWGHPSRDLELFGVTGTNGKTTTTYLMDSIFRSAGRTTGLIGTVETRVGDSRLSSPRTTPESADLQELLARMRDAGVEACSVEVSSHAIDLHRVDGLSFAVAAFTNLSQDHLDYHHTLEEYSAVKRRFFTDFDVRKRVVDVDDPFGRNIADSLGLAWTCGTAEQAAVRATDIRLDDRGSSFGLSTPTGTVAVRLPLAGSYNVSNALLAAASGLAMGIGLEDVCRGLESAPQVPGRLERIEVGQPFAVVVDYAHTPDSLAKSARAMRDATEGRLIVVFGCGGDRDPEKRPLMGQAAARESDHAIITSDNPRSEDPVGIILQIEDGLRGTGASYEVEVDRRRAIARALSLAGPEDAVLIAGKGHEDYQIFSDRTIHFDDREVAREEVERVC